MWGSDDAGAQLSERPPAPGSTEAAGLVESSPFSVGPVPEGFELSAVGSGTADQEWSSDSVGTEEPFTVLSSDGTPTGADVVVVSQTGYEGYQGGLDQAGAGSPSDLSEGRVSEDQVDGKEARFYRGGGRSDPEGPVLWADLVVAIDDDLAIRVTSPTATRDELVRVFRQAAYDGDHARAPTVDQPPDGLQVVGSVDADLILAFQPYAQGGYGYGYGAPGSDRAKTISWSKGDSDLSVMTLPGDAVDLAALEAVGGGGFRYGRYPTTSDLVVDGQRALSLTLPVTASVISETAWGDVVVAASTGPDAASVDEEVALAESVTPISDAAWESFVVDATGGPGLHPDEGRVELARGEVDGVGWLLQSGTGLSTPASHGSKESGSDRSPTTTIPAQVSFDPCLKLSTRTRACVGAASGSGSEVVALAGSPGTDLEGIAPFMIVSTELEGTEVRISVEGRSATATLVPAPVGDLSVALVFLDPGEAVRALCGPKPAVFEDMPVVRADVLDEAGTVLGCIGR